MPVAHDLIQDLPEFRQRLRRPETDPTLQRLLDEHHDLDRQALKLERHDTPARDDELNRLRRERVLAKDRIERHLRYGS